MKKSMRDILRFSAPLLFILSGIIFQPKNGGREREKFTEIYSIRKQKRNEHLSSFAVGNNWPPKNKLVLTFVFVVRAASNYPLSPRPIRRYMLDVAALRGG